MMLSLLDSKMGFPKEGGQALSKFVKKHPEFNYYYLLAYYYDSIGESEKAIILLEEAVKFPIRDLKDDMYTSDQPLGMMPYCGPYYFYCA